MSSPGVSAQKSFQSMPQMQTSISQQNGTMSPSSSTGQKYLVHQHSAHAMSGYAMALTPRHDRVDYSMAKGGFRLWIVLFVFFMLVSGMITIFSNKKEFIQVELDIDGDGRMDDFEHEEDIDDAVHSETKHEQEKIDRSAPTRTFDRVPSPPDLGRRRAKSDEKKGEDSEEHEHKHEDAERVKTAADSKHTVGPVPPIQRLKEPITRVIKKAVEPGEEEEEESKLDQKPHADEETLLQRLWEKMKKTVEEQQRQHEENEEEEKPEPAASKRRKRGEKQKRADESEIGRKPEPEEREPAPEKPTKRRAKTKPAAVEEEKPEAGRAELEEEKPKEPERPSKRRRVKPEPEVVKEKEPEEAEKAQEPQEAEGRGGKRRRTKVEVEREPEPEAEEPKERATRRRKTKEEAKEEWQIEEPLPAPAERPKVRVFRAKGRPKDEPKPTAAPEPEPEPEAVPEPEPEVEEPPPKPKIPVRVIRRKGRPKEEVDSSKIPEDHDKESPPEPEETKAQVKVRFFRVRGKKPEEILQTFAERQLKEEREEVEIEEEREQRRQVPVRVYRTKGKTKEDGFESDGSEEGKTTALRVPEYRKRMITNRDDNKIRQLLDEADHLVDQRRLDEALSAFGKLLKVYPRSPRAHYGKAKALELIAAEKQSNAYLDASIRQYETTLRLPHLTDALERLVTDRLVDRSRFRGWLDKAAQAQSRLVDKYPNDLDLLNDFGVTYLMMGRHEDAKKIFDNVLSKDPENGFALVHYGFILKTVDENYTFAVDYMRRGIETEDDGTQDGRFYFHLGDALQKLNRTEEAYELYEEAAELGIFLSKYQRSLYNVAGLTAQPFWTPEQTPYVKQIRAIESEWKTIRDEGLALRDEKSGLFQDDDEEVAIYGNLKEFVLYAKGHRIDANCAKAPKTCAIVARFPEATTCTRGEIKFSLMEGGTRVWPHCGPTNCRLRGHLGLVVPPESRLRVGDETKSWRQGKLLILDDSFENEVWHDGTGFRLLLVIDFWHPELSVQQRASLTPI